MLGLDNAGKTTLMKKLAGEVSAVRVLDVVPPSSPDPALGFLPAALHHTGHQPHHADTRLQHQVMEDGEQQASDQHVGYWWPARHPAFLEVSWAS